MKQSFKIIINEEFYIITYEEMKEYIMSDQLDIAWKWIKIRFDGKELKIKNLSKDKILFCIYDQFYKETLFERYKNLKKEDKKILEPFIKEYNKKTYKQFSYYPLSKKLSVIHVMDQIQKKNSNYLITLN